LDTSSGTNKDPQAYLVSGVEKELIPLLAYMLSQAAAGELQGIGYSNFRIAIATVANQQCKAELRVYVVGNRTRKEADGRLGRVRPWCRDPRSRAARLASANSGFWL